MKMKNLPLKLMMLVMASTCLTGIGNSQTCPAGMVSYWNFDDLSSSSFKDSYGNHDAESDNSIATVAAGKVGSAKYLSGTDVISVPDHSDFDFGTNTSFSIECWVKYSNSNPGTNQVIIGRRDSQTSKAYWFLGIEDGTGKVFFELQDNNGVYKDIYSSSALNTGAWHHIIGIRDESINTNKLYVDGALVASVVYDYTGSFSSDGSILIGAFLNSSLVPAYFLQGSIDETAIYNRALSETEISEHLLKNNNKIGYCDGYSPVIKSTPVTTGVVGQEYIYTVYASGMPVMNYSLLAKPNGMTIDGSTGVISWTPASINDNGWVEVRASNNVAPADTQRFRIFLAEAPVCPDGISVLLKLNETSGPTYIDYYNGHNATATTAPTATTGKINGGQAFSAVTGIDIPDKGNEFEWTYTNNFSFEFWMKTSSTATMVIMGRHRKANDSPDAAAWWVGTDDSGKATFSLQDNNPVSPKLFEISGGPVLSDNNWHHVVAVRNGSLQKNILFVDGINVVEATTDYANSFMADSTTNINLGYWNRANEGENEYHYVGVLDEVAIFNKALTGSEVAGFYNGGAPVGHCAINNYAPVITSTPVTAATEDLPYTYTFTIEDVDASNLITLSAPTKPDWLTFNYITGQKTATLTGTPTNAQVGNHPVVLQVYDGTVTKNQSFTITVANVNDSPVITSTAILTGYVGELYAYVLSANDVDANTTLTYSAVTKPEWLTFDPVTGILTGTPAEADKGDNVVLLRVNDGIVDVDQSFTIVVDGPDAINDLSDVGISIFPVPAKDYLTVRFSNLAEDTQLDIISTTGGLVKKLIVPANQNSYKIDLSDLENGLYYIHFKNNTINNIGKFVITK
jgi:hypothetical protein